MSINTYVNRNSIDNYLNNLNPELIMYIYGGITNDTSRNRWVQHVEDKEPKEFDSDWVNPELDNPITRIKRRENESFENFRIRVVEVENYLIVELVKRYGLRCVNDKNKDGSPSQRGGSGMHDIPVGDYYNIYIFYKKMSIVFV
jgi:hypothetical protein